MKYLQVGPIAQPMALLSSAAILGISLGMATPTNARTGDIPDGVVVPTQTMRESVTLRRTVKQMAQVSDAALARQAHTAINRHRAAQQLPPLQWSDAVAFQARQHSEAMAKGRTSFGHSGFSQRVRAIQIPFRGAAENVAYNQGYSNPAQVAVDGWLKSPGHRSNIEGRYDTGGIGVARNAKGEVYFTQVFLRSR